MIFTRVSNWQKGQLLKPIYGSWVFCLRLFMRSDIRTRSILHDERVYPEPEAFRPERYLDNKLTDRTEDPSILAFGFGRR